MDNAGYVTELDDFTIETEFVDVNLYANLAYRIDDSVLEGKLQPDVVLKLGKETFDAHRCVLVQHSDYFRAMFGVDMVERSQDAIELQDVDGEMFRELFKYFYSGKVHVTNETCMPLIATASFFQVDWVANACAFYLLRSYTAEKYNEAFDASQRFGLATLKTNIMSIMGEKLTSVFKRSDYQQLSFELLHALLSSNAYLAMDECTLLDKTICWCFAQYDTETVFEKLSQLTRCINLHQLSLDERRSLAEKHSGKEGTQNPSIHLFLDEQTQLNPAQPNNPRSREPQLVMLGRHSNARWSVRHAVPNASNSKLVIEKDLPADATAQTLTDLQIHAAHFLNQAITCNSTFALEFGASVCCLGNHLYVTCGRATKFMNLFLYRYDLLSAEWDHLANMPEARTNFAFCGAQNKLFTLGGVNSFGLITNTFECYNTSERRWSTSVPYPVKAFKMSSAAHGALVYASGGIKENGPASVIATAYQFSVETRHWTAIPDLLHARKGHSMLFHEGQVYVFGGTDNSGDTVPVGEVLSTDTDQWTQLHWPGVSFRQDLMYELVTVAVSQGRFYALWSCIYLREDDKYSIVVQYDPSTNELVEVYNTRLKLCHMCSVQMPRPPSEQDICFRNLLKNVKFYE